MSATRQEQQVAADEERDADYENQASASSSASEASEAEYEEEEADDVRPRKKITIGRKRRNGSDTAQAGTSTVGGQQTTAGHKKPPQADTETHTRGLLKPSNHSSKTLQLRLTFGSSDQDILPVILTRDLWSGNLDLTFPSKESLVKCSQWSSTGDTDIFGTNRAAKARESTAGWDWFYSDVGKRFRNNQWLTDLSEEEVQTYLPNREVPKLTVLMGPAGSQSKFLIGRDESFDFGSAWPSTRPVSIKKEKVAKTGSNTDNEPASIPRRMKTREGWILNLGNRIQCLSWAPNCEGRFQFLATVAPILDEQKAGYEDGSIKGAPAFTPSAPYPAAIQIWKFGASDVVESSSGIRRLDMSVKPCLHMVICTDLGNITRLEWCPIDVRKPPETGQNNEVTKPRLLAGLWSDGSVKVFNVDLRADSTNPVYLSLKRPAFEVKPPLTVCTCLTWLSPTDIAIGCADGSVGLWSLVASTRKDYIPNPEPYVYIQVHDTYILNIVSAYPTFPHMIATTSIGGQTRLISILDPTAEISDALRLRVGTRCLTYSPFLRSFITNDEGDLVRLLPIRRFFSSLAAIKSPSAVTALANASFHHPCIIGGNASGSVIAKNPLRKLLHSKDKHWQQTWFSQEWVNGENSNNKIPGPAVKFYDGFKAETINLSKGASSQDRETGASHFMVIYEAQSAITAVEWNPNMSCAGWACAGMGSGLIRVEDLAHE